ncbi:hypothetical protein SY88_00110 [Clostridiales bacterium PH28_bin88]|nr:hypothetical protein SY88_00110 [Clostridiales bacterium PH28_bin88]
MKAVILAGGLGTRLRPVVSNVPKSMAIIAGKPFLEYQVNWLAAQGVCDIVFCLGYMAEKIKEHFGDGAAFGVHIEYSVEDKPLGTAGALGLARHLLSPTFLVLNGDTFLDVLVEQVLGFHLAKEAVLSLVMVQVNDMAPYGEIVTDDRGKVLTFCEKGRQGAGLINAGIYIMEKSILDIVPVGQTCSLEEEILPRLLEQGQPVYGFVHKGFFLDIGTPENYKRAQNAVIGRFGR